MAEPERTLTDGTPCWCPDPDIPSHTPKCIVLRSVAGVKGSQPPWLQEHAGSHTREMQDAFIIAFAEWGIIRAACEAAGVNRDTVANWRKNDPDFAQRMATAKESAVELLEMEAERRARIGWEEPVYQQGQQIGTVRKFSDAMLALRLKAEKPTAYRDNLRLEASGPDGNPLQVQALPVMDDHERSALRRVLEEAIAAQVASEQPEPAAEPTT